MSDEPAMANGVADSTISRSCPRVRDKTPGGIYEIVIALPRAETGQDMAEITFNDLWLRRHVFNKVQPDDEFDVPQEVLEKPELIFGYHVVVLYENEAEAYEELSRAFGGVTGQAIWLWRRNGLPVGRRKQLANIITDPEYRFRLAENVSMDDLIKPYHLPVKRRPKAAPRTNEAWLDLLAKIELGAPGFERYSRSDLPRLAARVSRGKDPLPTWHLYRWGWENGGVPPSNAKKVWEALLWLQAHVALGVKRAEFVDYCEKHFKASTRGPTQS